MKLKTDSDRALLQHLQDQIADDIPYFWGILIQPEGAPPYPYGEISVMRFAQAGLLKKRESGAYEIIVDAVEELASAGQPPKKRRGPEPDPERERIETCYLENGAKANYYDIVDSLQLKKWNGRTPHKRVQLVVNAMQQRKRRKRT